MTKNLFISTFQSVLTDFRCDRGVLTLDGLKRMVQDITEGSSATDFVTDLTDVTEVNSATDFLTDLTDVTPGRNQESGIRNQANAIIAMVSLSSVNCQASTVNCQLSTVNCQLSTVNHSGVTGIDITPILNCYQIPLNLPIL